MLCIVWYGEGESLPARGKGEYIRAAKKLTSNLDGCEWRLTEGASIAGQGEGSRMTSRPPYLPTCTTNTRHKNWQDPSQPHSLADTFRAKKLVMLI